MKTNEQELHVYSVPLHLPEDRLEFDKGWLTAHARWASHTGYRSLGCYESVTSAEVEEYSQSLYQNTKMMPFLVGPWDTQGFSVIYEDTLSPKNVRFRLPYWAEDEIKNALTEVSGARETCAVNRYWTFPAGVDKKRARDFLEPLLKPETRLKDQTILANELRKSDGALAVAFEAAQIGLFD